MAKVQLVQEDLDFLKALHKNNNREWFTDNKDRYTAAQQRVEVFAEALLQQLQLHDVIETLSGKKSMHRIYRDIRFSSDKTPYKCNWSGGFKRATRSRRGGYYYHIEPGNKSEVVGGFWAPNAPDLKRIRDEVAFDAAPLRKILQSKTFVANFGTLQGEQLKTAPKGFDKDSEGVDLLRYKQFLLRRTFTDEEVLSPSFVKLVSDTFKNMRPFFDYMSEVLTTDMNGIAL
ncbi:TIGR02453 family protein [Filimonas lacunae]|uniref:TIGR02453 family protein n=1 Tax=Filimonas lacunae TaxID=477680 RepID=A0A173MHZ9_9BACT|nr:DUF2461 domain-containing protein [Filimonas lacunae]BAV07252.1 hypothetical protein FLA_3275 [Filimonas lacunae]SIS92544.1 TIGR02453 family protein [Filimonas lacunae]